MVGNHPFKVGDAGSSPVNRTNIGMDYGDSRVCKTPAGQFESDASHKNWVNFRCRNRHPHVREEANKAKENSGKQTTRCETPLTHKLKNR